MPPRLPASAAVRSLAVAALLGLVACTTVEQAPPQTPFELPATFSAPALGAYELGDRWWEAFGDPQLDQFVELTLARNPELAQAMARARMAEAQARVQRADQLPQVGLGAGTTRQRQNLPAMPGLPGMPDGAAEGGTLSTNHNLTVDVSWELDLWGRLSALSASARAEYLASGERLRSVRQAVAAQVVQHYLDIVHARAQVDLSTRTVRALAEMARQINNRVDVGIASPADGMLANANLASAEAGLEQSREVLARGLRQLEVLMGDYPSGTVQTAQVLPSVPPPPPAGVPAGLLARRPDVRAAELGLRSAGYQLDAAQRARLPSLSLTGSAGFSANALSDLLNTSNLIWSIAGRILQPVFQGGRLTAQVDVAEGQRDELVHAYAQTALTALAEVESALAVDTILARRETALNTAASTAEEAMKVSLNRYLQGIDPFLNVLESQQRALDGRSAYLSARHARLDNRIALHLALGGGFEDEPLPAKPAAAATLPLTSPRP